jgi:hypothetical protein
MIRILASEIQELGLKPVALRLSCDTSSTLAERTHGIRQPADFVPRSGSRGPSLPQRHQVCQEFQHFGVAGIINCEVVRQLRAQGRRSPEQTRAGRGRDLGIGGAYGHWRMVASTQGDGFPLGMFIATHFEFNEPETFWPALIGHKQRDDMPRDRAGQGLVHEVGTLDLQEVFGSEHAVPRRAEPLTVQSAPLARRQFPQDRTHPRDWLCEVEPKPLVNFVAHSVKSHGLQWAGESRYQTVASAQPQPDLAALRERRRQTRQAQLHELPPVAADVALPRLAGHDDFPAYLAGQPDSEPAI